MLSDRSGETFGKLTITDDLGGDGLLCRCKCGREGVYPRAITKPSYRGPRACPWCLGTPCEECGTIIPSKGRMPAKTCSDSCRVARANRREKERYQRIKDTNHFKETRAAYLFRLAQAMEDDPEFAESLREDHRRAVREWRDRQMANPALRARYLKAHREREAKRLDSIRSDPDAYAEHLRRQREWYRSLNDADYRRVYREPKVKSQSNINKKWSKKEDQFIADNRQSNTIAWIARQLGRTEASVYMRLRRTGSPKKVPHVNNRANWSDDAISMLGNKPDVDIANDLGIRPQSVAKKRKSLGIPAYRKQREKPRTMARLCKIKGW